MRLTPEMVYYVYGFVLIGNGVAFTHADETKAPLLARIRYQYCVFRLRPVCVRVITPAPTFAVLRPAVNVELVARWIVKPVSLFEASCQVKITVRLLPFPFGPLIAVKLPGTAGTAGMATAARFEYTD